MYVYIIYVYDYIYIYILDFPKLTFTKLTAGTQHPHSNIRSDSGQASARLSPLILQVAFTANC